MKDRKTINVDKAVWKRFRIKCIEHGMTASGLLEKFMDQVGQLPNGGMVHIKLSKEEEKA